MSSPPRAAAPPHEGATADPPGARVRWAQRAVAGAALVATAVLAAQALAGALGTPTPLTPYKEPQWWLTYDAGFVRRGLPGEVLAWVAGGPPDRRAVAAAGVALTCAAALAVVALARALAQRAPSRTAGLLVAALVLASPLTVSLLLHDWGRYDGVGVLALAVLAAAPGWTRLPGWAAAVAAGALVAVATAAQELLLPVLAPAALLRAGAGRPRPALSAAVLAPGAAVAAASALLPPAPEAVTGARAAALEAGVPRQGGWGDALDAVDRSLVENVAFFGFFEPAAVAWSLGLWAGLYAATAGALAGLLGRTRDRAWWALAGYQAACAVALSLLGVDFRRWWGLALLGLLAAAALVRPPPGRGRTVRTRAVAAVAVLVAVGLRAADVPVFPVVPLPRG